MVLLIGATCNKFKSEDVRKQWETIESEYKAELEAVVGPLIGHSSDGDSRRRKLMLENQMNESNGRYQPIPSNLGFSFSVKKEESPNAAGGYVIRGIGDQDAIHQHKKFINPLDHPVRVMMMGTNFMVHMNHLQRVADMFPRIRHGLGKSHIERTDRQNWRIAQEMTFLPVQACLRELVDGANGRAPYQALRGRSCISKLSSIMSKYFFTSRQLNKLTLKVRNFPKPHAKQENIWRNQFPPNISDVNLTDYPRKGMEIDARCSGIQMA